MKRIVLKMLVFWICNMFVVVGQGQELTNDDFRYHVQIGPDGSFYIKLEQKFSEIKSLSSIFVNGYFNEAKQKKADENLLSQKLTNNILDKFDEVGSYHFKTVSQVTKYNVKAKIENSCFLLVGEDVVKSNCSVTQSTSIIGSFFYYGSSSIDCHKDRDQGVNCVSHIRGRPRGVNFFTYRRSAQRLAVSGAVHFLKTMYRLHYLMLDRDVIFSQSEYYKKNLAPVWNAMISVMDDGQSYKGIMEAYSGDHGHEFMAK